MKLLPPCSYQGGKQRLAKQICEILIENADETTKFYDFCCGSGAISIQLVNFGVKPENIIMCDASSWGVFWNAIGSGTFNIELFKQYIDDLPEDKFKYKEYFENLIKKPIEHEAELYTILQAASFGGKQITRNSEHWIASSFRSYWQPTETSNRKSPVNPMQPSPNELFSRVNALAFCMKGLKCYHSDVFEMLNLDIDSNSVVYIDPPYKNTAKYQHSLDYDKFIKVFKERFNVPLYISEGYAFNDKAIKLDFNGAKGGISGKHKITYTEYLNSV